MAGHWPGCPNPLYPGMNSQAYTSVSIMRSRYIRYLAMILAPALLLAAGCADGRVTADPSNAIFSISPGAGSIDTNCTGCNAANAQGISVEQLTATLAGGGAAPVTWSLSGGDANSGPGSMNAAGQYTPPSYLTADRVDVLVTATLNANPGAGATATAVLTLTPGFLQPLTPENLAMGANGQVIITGYLAEAGGYTGINFALSSSAIGSSGGQGSLSSTTCQRGAQAFTYCTVTYTAPATVSATGATYVVATAGSTTSKAAAEILLNTAGVASNPATHQAQLPTPAPLGASAGNNIDFDTRGNQIVDCCSGTLGALIQDSGNRQYLLSNNHVLARSDHAAVGDTIIQPGLIDNNCTPNGEGPGAMPVGSLTGWLALKSSATNADAAIAQVDSGAVDLCRQHSGTGRPPVRRHTGRRASRRLLHRRQGRDRVARSHRGQERAHHRAYLRRHLRPRSGRDRRLLPGLR